ncbi:MAG: hypothetical protein ACI4FV_03425 [Lachnospiraceae bacterium]
MCQMKQNMDKEQFEEFIQNSLRKGQRVADHKTLVNMDVDQLREWNKQQAAMQEEKSTTREEKLKIPEGLPVQNADEKARKRKKREKNHLRQQDEKVQSESPEEIRKIYDGVGSQLNDGKLDNQSLEVLYGQIDITKLSPRYVYENYGEVRLMLDKLRVYLDAFESSFSLESLLSEDQKLRCKQLKDMYQKCEWAFYSAIIAMGYRFQKNEDGTNTLLDDVSDEEKKNALKENMDLRRKIFEIEKSMDDKVADQLIEKEKIEQHKKSEKLRRNPEFDFIKSEYLSQEYQFLEIKSLHDLLEKASKKSDTENQEPSLLEKRYMEHEEEIGRMYEEFFHLMEACGIYDELQQGIKNLVNDEKKVSGDAVGVRLNVKLEDYRKKKNILLERARSMQAGIRYLLEGDQLWLNQSLTVMEYLKPQDQLDIMFANQEAQAQAAYHVDIERQNKEIFESTAKEQFGERVNECIGDEGAQFETFIIPGQKDYNEKLVHTVMEIKNGKELIRKTQAAGFLEDAKALETEIGLRMKSIIQPHLERIKDYDMPDLSHCTDKELLAENEVLQQVYLSVMSVKKAGEYIDSDDQKKRSIKESFLEHNHLLQEVFDLKCNMIKVYAEKARMLSMVKAYEEGVLTENCFTDEELGFIRNYYGLKPGQPLQMSQMLLLAKEKLVLVEISQDGLLREFYKNPAKAEKLERNLGNTQGVYEEWKHERFKQERDEVIQNIKRELKLERLSDPKDVKKYYHMQKEKANRIQKELKKANNKETRQLAKKYYDEVMRRIEMTQIIYALEFRNYRKVDDVESPLGEAMFHSIGSLEESPAFQAMNEETFRTMCLNLSAGALEDDAVTPEEYDHYYAKNKEGLRTYKEYMRQHYEMLDARFHHQIPSLEYIILHMQDLKQLFGRTQIDLRIADMVEVVDLTNEDDLRLYHLIRFYSGMSSFIGRVNKDILDADGKFEKFHDFWITFMMDHYKSTVDYLNSGNDSEESENILKKRIYRVDDFRQLAKDAEDIVEKDQATQQEFVLRVMEMTDLAKNFIYFRNESPTLVKRLTAWLELAGKRVWFMAQERYGSTEGLPDDASVLDNEDNFVAAMKSEDPAQYLNGAFEMSKMSLFLLQEDIPEEDEKHFRENRLWRQYLEIAQDKINHLNKADDVETTRFVEAYYEKKSALANRMNEEILKLQPYLSQRLSEEKKKLFATYQVSLTKLGRDYRALSMMSNVYRIDMAHLQPATRKYGNHHPEAYISLMQLDSQIERAEKEYSKEMGYKKVFNNMLLKEFEEKFE